MTKSQAGAVVIVAFSAMLLMTPALPEAELAHGMKPPPVRRISAEETALRTVISSLRRSVLLPVTVLVRTIVAVTLLSENRSRPLMQPDRTACSLLRRRTLGSMSSIAFALAVSLL